MFFQSVSISSKDGHSQSIPKPRLRSDNDRLSFTSRHHASAKGGKTSSSLRLIENHELLLSDVSSTRPAWRCGGAKVWLSPWPPAEVCSPWRRRASSSSRTAARRAAR